LLLFELTLTFELLLFLAAAAVGPSVAVTTDNAVGADSAYVEMVAAVGAVYQRNL
jgi:hypothetical protein